ncbi:MAG: 30S ribosomal protein S8 [Candidatus Geothermincolia bacterium]
MKVTDPIADMLTRIRNANIAYHEQTKMPSSRMKVHMAELLANEGYIEGFEIEHGQSFDVLKIRMKYGPNRERVISGLKKISKPGLRIYTKRDDVPKVLGGLGVAIISTSKGLITDKEARKLRLGGEVIAFVW